MQFFGKHHYPWVSDCYWKVCLWWLQFFGKHRYPCVSDSHWEPCLSRLHFFEKNHYPRVCYHHRALCLWWEGTSRKTPCLTVLTALQLLKTPLCHVFSRFDLVSVWPFFELNLTREEFFCGEELLEQIFIAILSEAHNLNGDLNGYVRCQRFPTLKGPMCCTPGTLDHDLKVHPFIGGFKPPTTNRSNTKNPGHENFSPRIIGYNIWGILSYSSSSSRLVIQSKYPSCILLYSYKYFNISIYIIVIQVYHTSVL